MKTESNNYSATNIEANVMRRVYFVHLIQTLFAPVAFSIAVLLIAAWGIGREVWVAHVIQNMPAFSLTHIMDFLRFFESAFLNTRTVVQLLVLSILTAGALLALNFVQIVRQSLRYS